MNIFDQIKKWLSEDGAYTRGVMLYAQIGGAYPISYFQGYSTAPFVPDDVELRLKNSLEAYLCEYAEEEVEERTIVQKEVITIVQKEAVVQPTEIIKLKNDAKILHKRHAMLHAQMSIINESETRYELAKEIMEEVIPDLDKIYEKIRIWKETGEVPAVIKTDLAKQILAQVNLRLSHKSRISRIKKKLKTNLLENEKQKLEKELLAKQLAVAEIEQELGIE